MTETQDIESKRTRKRRRCFIIGGVILCLILAIFIVILVLALTVFKAREPQIELVSASLDGFSPRISFPVINIELNITLNISLLVHNPNYASLSHGGGKCILVYKDSQVGEADLNPGLIPSRGSTTVVLKLTLEVDEFAEKLTSLISDILAGELVLQTQTRIPGRVKFLGIIKKHVVATSACSFRIDIPNMKIQKQACKTKTKF